MATRNLTSSRRFSWLNRWWWPFLWIILTPIVTVYLSGALFSVLAYHEPQEVGLPPNPPHRCPFLPDLGLMFSDDPLSSNPDPDCGPQFMYSEVSPTIIAFVLPGLLNLVPFLWVTSRRSMVRTAGIVAGLLGLLRLSIPLIVIALVFDRVSSDGGSYFEYGLFDSPFIFVWFFGALAWLGTLLVWAVFWGVTGGEEGI